MRYSVDDIEITVLTSEKNRFGMELDKETGKLMVFCWQGHSDSLGIDPFSVQGMVALSPFAVPTVLVHGTSQSHLAPILKEGLKNKRRPIHFATTSDMSRVQGDVLLYVEARNAAVSDNIAFSMADNGVLLSNGVDGIFPSKYIMGGILKSDGTLLFGELPAQSGKAPAPEVIEERPKKAIVRRWGKATQEQPPINDCNQPLAGSNLGGSLQPTPINDCNQPLAGSNLGGSLQPRIILIQDGEDSSDDQVTSPCDRLYKKKLAKKVSTFLRHHAHNHNNVYKVSLDGDCFITFESLMSLRRFKGEDPAVIWNEVTSDTIRFQWKEVEGYGRVLRTRYKNSGLMVPQSIVRRRRLENNN